MNTVEKMLAIFKENNMATILELLQKNLNEFLGENSYQDDITIIGIE